MSLFWFSSVKCAFPWPPSRAGSQVLELFRRVALRGHRAASRRDDPYLRRFPLHQIEQFELRAMLSAAGSTAEDNFGQVFALNTTLVVQDPAVLKMFGNVDQQTVVPGAVSGDRGYHVSGVVVDRSVQPNIIYVADSGNNRILGFRSIESAQADLVFGQPDVLSSATNGDANTGIFAQASATSLALLNTPGGTNISEQWMYLNIDVDASGNLYVPDTYNNRVLVYLQPFSTDTTGGKGDSVADRVIGQANFQEKDENRGAGRDSRSANSLAIDFGNYDHVASRGVSVDPQGNVWVADTTNSRVLRFPPGSSTADLVLGQSDFTSRESVQDMSTAPLNRMSSPTLARVDPASGDVYVVDEYPGGFPARILVFSGPLTNGMSAARIFSVQQPLTGDFAAGYTLHHATGMVFNPVLTDDPIDQANPTHTYRDGFMWLHDGQGNRTLLLDRDGNILLALNAPDTTSLGSQFGDYKDPAHPYYVESAGGMIGFDSGNNIYLADGFWHRVARFALPYRAQSTVTDAYLPNTNGGLLGPQGPNGLGPAQHQEGVGGFMYGGQLILRDQRRYLAWIDPLSYADGAPADVIVGQPDGFSSPLNNNILERSMHAVDPLGRMWAGGEHRKLIVFQLPLVSGATALRSVIPIYWADDPDTEVPYSMGQAIAYDGKGALWIGNQHRLLRVRIPETIDGKLLVDAVIGQDDKVSNESNRGMNHPDAHSFDSINDIRFDPFGNMFVVDNHYEGGANGRVLAFLSADMNAITTMFPSIEAKRVFVAGDFDEPGNARTFPSLEQPFSPVSIAFNSRGEMVIGNDGYYGHGSRARTTSQLYLYRNPLTVVTPDAVIRLPLGAPGEITFDAADNLIVQDHTYNKVWIINFDRDPGWLEPIGDGLFGTYWPSTDFSGTPTFQIDREIKIASGPGGTWPVTGNSVDISARWTGSILPRYGQTYQFRLEHDDGARLWINGQLVIDGWGGGGTHQDNISLSADVAADILIEFKSIGPGRCNLFWKSSSQVEEIVPQGRLFSGKPKPFFGLPGDFDLDGDIDGDDVSIVADGIAAPSAAPVYYADGDFNGDGVVSAIDLASVTTAKNNWELPHVRIEDVRKNEGDAGSTSFSFPVTLSHVASRQVSLNFQVLAGTARVGVDIPVASGQIVMPAGQTSATITVTVSTDTIYEPDESFFVDISLIGDLYLEKKTGVGTIVNDDSAPPIIASASSLTIPEGEAREIGVHLSAQPSSNVLVNIVKLSGDADFTNTFTLLFTPTNWSTPQPVRIAAVHDGDTVDDHATFRIAATAPAFPADSAVLVSVAAIDSGVPYALGSGLNASYYHSDDLTGSSLGREDDIVDFTWFAFGPDAAIAPTTFSGRWEGFVRPRFGETYTFSVRGDGGVRLWVNDTQLIDSWSPGGGVVTRSGSIALVAGKAVAIKLEYRHESGSAITSLEWESESQEHEIVPQARLLLTDVTAVARRNVFYNNSKFDGNSAQTDSLDDAAIAADKSAYLPGAGTPTINNITSYLRGINGVMVDLAGPHGPIGADDFNFVVRTSASDTWTAAPVPTSVVVRSGAGVDGSDRIEIVWADAAIRNEWLAVTMLANDDTALASDDIFSFGNLVGETVASGGLLKLTASDALQIISRLLSQGGGSTTVDDKLDIDRDGKFNARDALLVISRLLSDTAANRELNSPALPALEEELLTSEPEPIALSVTQSLADEKHQEATARVAIAPSENTPASPALSSRAAVDLLMARWDRRIASAARRVDR